MSAVDSVIAAGLAKADARRRYLRPPSGTYATIGDSITALGDASTAGPPAVNANVQQSAGPSWHSFLSILSGQRLRRVGYFATPGFTVQQIYATHLPQVLALSPAPEACIVHGGTNNVSVDPDNQYAYLKLIIAALQAAGIRPILVKLPPRHDTSPAKTAVPLWNARVQALASANGYQVWDAYSPSVNVATGDYLTGQTSDYIHPTSSQLAAIAAAHASNAAWLGRFGDATPYLVSAPGDTATIIDSDRGLFLADANADGLSDGWTIGGTGATYTRSQDAAGFWMQRINKATSSSLTGSIFRNVTAGFAVGDSVYLAAKVNASSSDPNFNWSLSATPKDSGGNALSTPALFAANALKGAVITGGTLYAEMVVPAGTVSWQVILSVGSATPASAAYVEFSRVTFGNKTTLKV